MRLLAVLSACLFLMSLAGCNMKLPKPAASARRRRPLRLFKRPWLRSRSQERSIRLLRLSGNRWSACPRSQHPRKAMMSTSCPPRRGVGQAGRYKESGLVVTPIKVYLRTKQRTELDMKIPHAMNLYVAEHGHFPKTPEDFVRDIIQFNQVRLPKLPPGHRYVYDAKRATAGGTAQRVTSRKRLFLCVAGRMQGHEERTQSHPVCALVRGGVRAIRRPDVLALQRPKRTRRGCLWQDIPVGVCTDHCAIPKRTSAAARGALDGI